MYYDEESGSVNFLVGMLMGVALGAAVALLAAPQSGKRTRRRLLKAVSTARGAAGDRFDDIAGDVRSAVEAGRKRMHV